MRVKVKSITLTNKDAFLREVMQKVGQADHAMAEKLGQEIVSYVKGKGWNHSPDMTAGAAKIEGTTATSDLDTNDKIYGWVDKGTAPVTISGLYTETSTGGKIGKMRFRNAGRGVSYASKTDGRSGGDGRGQIGPMIRAANVTDRSIRARHITDDVIKNKEKDIEAVGQSVLNQ